jgi:hypothetical protein
MAQLLTVELFVYKTQIPIIFCNQSILINKIHYSLQPYGEQSEIIESDLIESCNSPKNRGQLRLESCTITYYLILSITIR